MDISIGNLRFSGASDYPKLLAGVVADALAAQPHKEAVGVAEINPDLSDTATFCDHYGISLHQAANCVIVEGRRGEERYLAAVIILADTRADINGVVKKELGAKRVSFAQMEKAVSESKMEFGAITPVGLPKEWPILIDQAVAGSEYVIVGSGIRSSKLAVTGRCLASLPNTRIVDGLAAKK